MKHTPPQLKEERGQVILIVVLLIPLLFAIGAIVVDLGNFFEHRRHLQTQADSAALAAGGSWSFPCSQAVSDEIERHALKYAGAHNADAHRTEQGGFSPAPLTPVNSQVGTTAAADVHVVLNSDSYWTSSTAPADFTSPAGDLCASRVAEVKITEANAKAFFGLLRPELKAKARVEIRDAISYDKSLPFTVESPAVTPCAWAIFVNESTGNIIGSPNPMSHPSGGDALTWELTNPVSVNIPAVNSTTLVGGGIGVRFRLGDCSDSNRQDTYSIDGSNNGANNSTSGLGLVFAQTYNPNWGANPSSPQQAAFLGPVTFSPITPCTDGNYVSKTTSPTAATCTVDILASVNFHGATGGVVQARMDGGGWVDLVDNSGTWRGGNFTIAAKSARHEFELRWARTGGNLCANNAATCASPPACANNNPFGNGNACKWGPVLVQKSFSAVVDRSGPILDAKILTAGNPSNALIAGGPVSLGARITVADLQAAQPGDDPVIVRTSVQNSDNRSGALDCAGGNFRSDIINGCTGYVENERGLICNPDLNPLDCVVAEPGNKSGQLRQGMDTRFGCTTNYWRQLVSNGTPIQQGDPRIATIFITSYGALSRDNNNPQTEVPIVAFASFYIVGWDGANGCAQNDPYPLSGSDAESVWGHFFKYVGPPSGGNPNTPLCNPTGIGTCVFTLVE